jgi:hypothetical protein
VWVNHAKWLERAIANDEGAEFISPELHGSNSYSRVDKVTITTAGMTVCETQQPTHKVEPCLLHAKSKLPSEPDKTEYPDAHSQRPPPFTIRVAQSKEDRLCSAMRDSRYPWDGAPALPSGASDLSQESATVPNDQLPAWVSLVSFDIDNDGKPDLILARHEASHASTADIYYLYDTAGLKQINPASKDPDADLLKNAKFVYPWSWEVCGAGENAPPKGLGKCTGSEEPLLPFKMIDSDGESIQFRTPYLSITPLKWQQSTYLILTSGDANQDHVAFVVKPLPQGKYEATCALESVRLNL